MLNLAEYRSKPQTLADFLPWAALVAPGVVLNKDGSFQRTARFRGPDLDSATPPELVSVTSRLNNALRRMGSGWAIFVEAQRLSASFYPTSRFPDPVSALVDAERRAQFEEEGSRSHRSQRGLKMSEKHPNVFLEALAGDRQTSTATMPLEQRDPQLVFEIADSSTYGGLLDPKLLRSASKTIGFSNRYENVEVL